MAAATPLVFSTVREAFSLIGNGARVVTAMAACEPQAFFRAADTELRSKQGVQVFCANPTEAYTVFQDESLQEHVTLLPMFLTSHVKNHQERSHVAYVPQHLSQWTHNLHRNGPVDVFWGVCSSPDPRGFVSLGPNVCYEPEVLRKAKVVILEVNDRLPFTHGDTTVSIDQVDLFLNNYRPLPTIPAVTPSDLDREVANRVAELVPDGATLQLGIGGIPNALVESLAHKKDLGVHTEMINDTIAKLTEMGVINGSRKTIWPGKIVGTFAYGTSALYDFIHSNPEVSLNPASIVNDPHILGKNHKMTSINTAVELDLTGQVCSESIGHYELSGVGGATDTHIGAQRSVGGQGIIALHSTTPKGVSKITAELKPGAKVSISRNDIDTVVTEYGVARLRGHSVAQRASSLISIAHPSVRDFLTHEAKRFGYL